MENVCKECGEELIGRADKKFCSDQCRNAFNNRNKQGYNAFIREINSKLRKNRRVLATFNPSGKTKVHRDKLIRAGLDFNYYTNTYITKEGKTYFYCYDQGYLDIGKGWYALVEKKEYVE
jgi:hypothetical protein